MTSSVTRGGYEPLPEAGEYVCDCYEHGTGEPWAHVGSSHVHERIVRCRDCVNCEQGYSDGAMFDATVCWAWDNGHDFPHYTAPDGFCSWGVEKEG